MKAKSRVPNLTMDNLVRDGWPDLRGPMVKAANTRNLYRFGMELSRQLDDGSVRMTRRRIVCQALHDVNEIIDSGPLFLVGDTLSTFVSSVHKIQVNMSWLARDAIERGDMTWKIFPKVHLLSHLADQAVLINPRFVRCYRQESGMGKIQKIYGSLMNGPYHDRIQRSTLQKQVIALLVSWAT